MIIDIKSKLAPSCSLVEMVTLKAMASKSSMEPSELPEPLDTEGHGAEANLPANIIQEKLEKNNPKIGGCVSNLQVLAPLRSGCVNTESRKSEIRNQIEALFCSDSEEEPEKNESPEQECHTEREVSQDRAGNISTVFAHGDGSSNIQENSDSIMEDDQLTDRRNFDIPVEDGDNDAGFMDKSLAANLDTFDCLFCLTCLIFNCRLHGNGSAEDVICPKRKQSLLLEEDSKPCGPQCHRLNLSKSSAVEATEKGSKWTLFEKDMYWKGIEIFGRNSCDIVRNLLDGLKTCREVADYMNGDGAEVPHSSGRKLVKEPILPSRSGPIQTKRSRGRKPSLGNIVNVKDGTSCEKSCEKNKTPPESASK